MTVSLITKLSEPDDISYIDYKINDLNSEVNYIWEVIFEMQERIDELENRTSCQLIPFGNCVQISPPP